MLCLLLHPVVASFVDVAVGVDGKRMLFESVKTKQETKAISLACTFPNILFGIIVL